MTQTIWICDDCNTAYFNIKPHQCGRCDEPDFIEAISLSTLTALQEKVDRYEKLVEWIKSHNDMSGYIYNLTLDDIEQKRRELGLDTEVK